MTVSSRIPQQHARLGCPLHRQAEVVRSGNFEAVLAGAVGLHDRVDLRVFTLPSPPRLIIDVRNH
jgi:hypothetical protein